MTAVLRLGSIGATIGRISRNHLLVVGLDGARISRLKHRFKTLERQLGITGGTWRSGSASSRVKARQSALCCSVSGVRIPQCSTRELFIPATIPLSFSCRFTFMQYLAALPICSRLCLSHREVPVDLLHRFAILIAFTSSSSFCICRPILRYLYVSKTQTMHA
jgi:hypothetical protein